MSFQLIQTISKDGRVSIDEFEINNKLFITPNAFLGIKSNANRRIDIDMNIVKKLFYTIENSDSFIGVYFPLESWLTIRRKLDSEQRILLMDDPINEKILLVPTIEALYYGPDNRMSKQLNLLNINYPSISDYYRKYRESLEGKKSSIQKYHKWLPNIDRNLRNYVFDFLRFQHNEKVLILIPPTPPIFNLENDLDYAEKTFQIGKAFLSATYDEEGHKGDLEPICLFIPLSINSFNTLEDSRRGTEKLERMLNNLNPDIVLIKIFDETLKHYNIKEKLKGLEYLCRTIIKYCKKNKRLSGIIDSKDYGRILLNKGINFVGIPVNRKSLAVSLGGSKSGPPPRNEWKLIDPETRDDIPFSNYQSKVESGHSKRGFSGYSKPLPHLRELMVYYNQDNIQNLTRMEQIEFSKLSPLVILSNDIAELKKAIIEKNVRTIISRFSRNASDYAIKVRTLLNEL